MLTINPINVNTTIQNRYNYMSGARLSFGQEDKKTTPAVISNNNIGAVKFGEQPAKSSLHKIIDKFKSIISGDNDNRRVSEDNQYTPLFYLV